MINRRQELSDNVNYPQHYTSHPSGVECIEITEHMSFCVGNAVKYLWRADLKHKGDGGIEDLRKARFYIEREINNRMNSAYDERFDDGLDDVFDKVEAR